MAIPTLTDIGNRIVQGVGTLTGQIRNPFTEQIEELESRLQATNNEDEIVKLNDQLRTLRAASDEWSSYDIAKQDPTAAPEWMQSVHNAARVGGDNLDLVDVGTAFIPVGVATKGAALVGRGLGKAGRGLGVLAGKYADNVVAKAGEKAAMKVAEKMPVEQRAKNTLDMWKKKGFVDAMKQSDVAVIKESSDKIKALTAEHNKKWKALERAEKKAKEESLYGQVTKRTQNRVARAEEEASKASSALYHEQGVLRAAEEALKNADVNIKKAADAAEYVAVRDVDIAARRAYTHAANKAAEEAANGVVSRGLTSAGDRLSNVGSGIERGATWLASHPVLGQAGEQALIEGAHGAVTYRPEAGETIGLNALEQGGLAGLMQGGVSALGGNRLRALRAMPENINIQNRISDLRARGFDVPEYNPLGMAGLRADVPRDIRLKETEKWRNLTKQMKKTKIPFKEAKALIEDTRKEELKKLKDKIYWRIPNTRKRPKLDRDPYDMFKRVYKWQSSPWEEEAQKRMWGPWVTGKPIYVEKSINAIPDIHPADMPGIDRSLPNWGPNVQWYPNKDAVNVMTDADKILKKKLEGQVEYSTLRGLRDQVGKNVDDLNGLYGLHYAPLPKGAISNRMADIYSAQTEPLTGFGTAGYRAAYNALLDALREGTEGGLDGLYGLGYVDE